MKVPIFVQKLANLLSRTASVALIALFLISFIPSPTFTSSQLTGPYGSVDLKLISFTVTNSTAIRYVGRAGVDYYVYSASGSVFIGGSWYYVNRTGISSTTSSSASQGSGASATNTSASAYSSASASATTSISATTQSEVPAPVKLYGYVTFYFLGGKNSTVRLSFSSPLYYSGNASSFETESGAETPADQPAVYVLLYIVPVNPYSNETVGEPLEYSFSPSLSASPSIDIYNAVVALPQFNDSMLWAYAVKPSESQPALPLAPYYNLTASVSIIVLIPIAFLDVLSARRKEDRNVTGVLAKISSGIIVMLAFPFIYDKLAYMMNVMDQMLIAYPLPYYDYSLNLANLEAYLVFPSSLSVTTFLSTTVLFVAYVLIAVILWIMNFLLGTVRVLLIAGMITLFPLSVALRDFRYTSKLGRIVEETLFGLMLASVLSSSMLGIAYFLLSNWSSPANMFRLAGIQPQWVAISAVLGALLAPTVLAPLVSAVYESTAMMASVAGGVATAEFLGVSGGALTGFRTTGGLAGTVKGAGLGLTQSWISSIPMIGSIGRARPYTIYAHQKQIIHTLDAAAFGNRNVPSSRNRNVPDYFG